LISFFLFYIMYIGNLMIKSRVTVIIPAIVVTMRGMWIRAVTWITIIWIMLIRFAQPAITWMIIWLRLYFWEDRGQRLSRIFFQTKNGDGLFYEITYYSVIFCWNFVWKKEMNEKSCKYIYEEVWMYEIKIWIKII